MDQQTNGNLALMPRAQMQPVSADWDTEEKRRLLRETYAKGLSPAEFELFVEHCRQIGLNPLTKQCQPVRFDGKTLSFFTTIHGLVAIACGSKAYAGMDPVHFDVYPKGETLGTQHPNVATATAWKIVQGQRVSFTAEVYWVERNKGQASWKVQPWSQLGKCAQAAAIRLGFEEVKGTYIEDELPPASIVEGTATESPVRQIPQAPKEAEPEFLPPQGKTWGAWCHDLAKELGIFDNGEAYLTFVAELTGKDPKQKYSAEEWATVAHKLQEMLWAAREEETPAVDANETEAE